MTPARATAPPEGTCLRGVSLHGVSFREPETPVTRQIFAVSRRGGDRKPAVRVVLDALAAEAARLPADHPAVPAPAPA